jgi:hypothetical protein
VVDPTMEAIESFRKQLDGSDMDVLRELVKVFAERLMSEQVDGICGAAYGERSETRVNKRNGYRERPVDTRVGTIDVQIPKLREGSYFPTWLVEPRRRAERALVAVVAECYVRGVSTRRVDGLVRTLGPRASPAPACRRWPRIWTRWLRRSAIARSTVGPTPTCGSMRSPRRSGKPDGSRTSRPSSPPG